MNRCCDNLLKKRTRTVNQSSITLESIFLIYVSARQKRRLVLVDFDWRRFCCLESNEAVMVRSLFVIALTALSALAHAISLPDARPEDISISKNILTGPQGKLHHAYHRALQTSDEPSSNAVASPSTSPSGPKSPTLIPTSSFSSVGFISIWRPEFYCK